MWRARLKEQVSEDFDRNLVLMNNLEVTVGRVVDRQQVVLKRIPLLRLILLGASIVGMALAYLISSTYLPHESAER